AGSGVTSGDRGAGRPASGVTSGDGGAGRPGLRSSVTLTFFGGASRGWGRSEDGRAKNAPTIRPAPARATATKKQPARMFFWGADARGMASPPALSGKCAGERLKSRPTTPARNGQGAQPLPGPPGPSGAGADRPKP